MDRSQLNYIIWYVDCKTIFPIWDELSYAIGVWEQNSRVVSELNRLDYWVNSRSGYWTYETWFVYLMY